MTSFELDSCTETAYDYPFMERPELLPYREQTEKYTNIMEENWPPDWPYHNFKEHAIETVDEFLALVDYARKNGLKITDETVVAGVLCSLNHDVQNHEPLSLSENYEVRAAYLGKGMATILKFPKQVTDQMLEPTLSTQPGTKCKTLLDIMVRRADIANLGWNYDRFKDKTVKYWREMQAQCDVTKPFSSWVRLPIVQEKLMQLVGEDLSLGEFDRDPNTGLSFFQTDIFNNFKKLDDELTSPEFIEPELYVAA